MIKIDDSKKIERYVEKYKLNNIFSNDMGEHMMLYMFNKGDYICREEEYLDKMFFLVDGKAKVSKHLENGKSLLISFYRPFTIIGDVEFIKNNTTDCSVQAIEDTYCIGISFDIVRSELIEDCKFLIKICDYLGEKLTSSSNNSSINLLYPFENRLASYIVAFANIKDDENKKFMFKENYNEIAELLGTTYRHLNRTLNKFCQDGILEKNNKEYIIQDYDKLLYLAGDLYK
ncbi:cyclic nucleotide-binding domain-containing protein [Clostridium sp. BL-8]|uniref:cyclic nucleotide-binding domain-containing protein n=1 Tax=Clostridium sp. BL-8 TaxID=349938 RepID=UPI00098CA65C|nr:cyclic nucleotide-binding domain-containing protein [Clostridium sp. BL-8]OOM77994.1 regulatory protein YeiL [Clostridium sp. BL-8]